MPNEQKSQPTTGQRIFRDAPEIQKELIRSILAEERKVMYLQRRSDIHRRIYDHVKRVIK